MTAPTTREFKQGRSHMMCCCLLPDAEAQLAACFVRPAGRDICLGSVYRCARRRTWVTSSSCPPASFDCQHDIHTCSACCRYFFDPPEVESGLNRVMQVKAGNFI